MNMRVISQLLILLLLFNFLPKNVHASFLVQDVVIFQDNWVIFDSKHEKEDISQLSNEAQNTSSDHAISEPENEQFFSQQLPIALEQLVENMYQFNALSFEYRYDTEEYLLGFDTPALSVFIDGQEVLRDCLQYDKEVDKSWKSKTIVLPKSIPQVFSVRFESSWIDNSFPTLVELRNVRLQNIGDDSNNSLATISDLEVFHEGGSEYTLSFKSPREQVGSIIAQYRLHYLNTAQPNNEFFQEIESSDIIKTRFSQSNKTVNYCSDRTVIVVDLQEDINPEDILFGVSILYNFDLESEMMVQAVKGVKL